MTWPRVSGVRATMRTDSGGTMEKLCDRNATAAGCKPGCTFDSDLGRPKWCDPRQAGHAGGDVYSCAFRPSNTGAMLRHQTRTTSGSSCERGTGPSPRTLPELGMPSCMTVHQHRRYEYLVWQLGCSLRVLL